MHAMAQMRVQRMAHELEMDATFSERCATKIGAGKESRTLDLNLGKVALYQLSYSRVSEGQIVARFSCCLPRVANKKIRVVLSNRGARVHVSLA